MKNIKNFKANFSKLLEDKYDMTQEGIKGYWANKSKEEEYDDKKMLGASVGFGGIIGTAGFAFIDSFNGLDCVIPIAIAGCASVLISGIALFKDNPYTLEEYSEIDETYNELKAKVMKKYKRK